MTDIMYAGDIVYGVFVFSKENRISLLSSDVQMNICCMVRTMLLYGQNDIM